MLSESRPRCTEAEYLALEKTAPERHEYINGEVVALVGDGPEHSVLCSTLSYVVRTALGQHPFFSFSIRQRVRISETGLYAYPDLILVFGPLRFAGPHPQVLLNPHVIFEVLSPSTEALDRKEKLAHYQQSASLRAHVLVSSTEERIEVFRRADATLWHYQSYEGEDSPLILTEEPPLQLALSDVYEDLRRLNITRVDI